MNPRTDFGYHPAKRVATSDKVSAVLRVLRGESPDALSSELGITVHRLGRWQNDFITGGTEALRTRRSLRTRNWLAEHATGVASVIGLAVIIGLLGFFLQRTAVN